MYGFSKYEAQGKYDEWNTTQVKLKLNNKTDADIIAWIRKQKYSRDTYVQGRPFQSLCKLKKLK